MTARHEAFAGHPAIGHVLRYFAYDHLPANLQAISQEPTEEEVREAVAEIQAAHREGRLRVVDYVRLRRILEASQP